VTNEPGHQNHEFSKIRQVPFITRDARTTQNSMPERKKKKKNSRPAFCHDHEHEHEHDLVNGASPLKIANRKIKITEADMLNWRGNCP